MGSDFLPNKGSYFDDQRESDTKAWERQRRNLAPTTVNDELLPLFVNLRNRPHATVSVQNRAIGEAMKIMFKTWDIAPLVIVNPNLNPTQVVVT